MDIVLRVQYTKTLIGNKRYLRACCYIITCIKLTNCFIGIHVFKMDK